MDEAVFFKALRTTGLFRSLTTLQVSGIQRIISAWDRYGYQLDTALAYILATSYHETGRRMQPVREAYGTSTADTIRRLDKAYAANKMPWVKRNYWRDGWFGRGDVQLTHESNYSGPLRDLVKKIFGRDIHVEPDAALVPAISAYILIEGTTKGLSLKSEFTKNTLETYINSTKTDYRNARATVNPGEKDSYPKVAAYAEKFAQAIKAGREAGGEEFKGEGFPVVLPRLAAPATAARVPGSSVVKATVPAKATVTNVGKTDDGVVVETAAEIPGAEAIEVPVPAQAETVDGGDGIYDGKYHRDLEVIQVMLQAKGYYTLDTANGKWNTRTGSAVVAFRRENGLPLVDTIDDQFIVTLVKAEKRAVSNERADATVGDVKNKPIVKDALTLDKVAKWIMGTGLVGTAATGGVDLAQTNQSLLSLQTLGTSFKAALPFLLFAAAGFGIFLLARRIVNKYLATYRDGGAA